MTIATRHYTPALLGVTPPKRGTEKFYGTCAKCGKQNVYLWRFVEGKGFCVDCAPKPQPPKANAPAVGSLIDLPNHWGGEVYHDTGDPQARVDMFIAQWHADHPVYPEQRFQWCIALALPASCPSVIQIAPVQAQAAPTSPAPYMPARGADLEDKVYLPQYEWIDSATANRQLGEQAQALVAMMRTWKPVGKAV